MLSNIQNLEPLHLIGAGLGFFVLYQIYFYLTVGAARRKIIKEYGCKPIPIYPHRDPIFGIDFAYMLYQFTKTRTVLQESQKRFQKYGNTYMVNSLGLKTITTCEPENVKNVLSIKFNDFEIPARRQKGFQPIFGKGIFTTNGEHWAHSRSMLRPNFTRSQVGDFATFETHVNHLINAIPRDGSTVDLQSLFFDLTVDSSTEFLFGESANTLSSGPKTEESFSEVFTYCTEKVGTILRSGLTKSLSIDKRNEKGLKIVHEFVDRYVRRALDEYYAEKSGKLPVKENSRYVFLKELVKQTQDPTTLRSESLNILLAGRDTTASLLADLWLILSQRPDVWGKLQAEVDQLDGRQPTFEEIKDMKYLRYCLNESLRLYPVVPANSRSAIRDTVLPRGGGPDGKSPIFVPKGTVLAYSTYTMQRREDIYGPDAAEFKPERWEKLRPGWEYLPFNGGPRICLGQQFALTEASYTTIRLMQEFRSIKSRDPEPWSELLTLTCASGNGTKVALSR